LHLGPRERRSWSASTASEVATLAALLASPRTGNVTGPNVIIDGGLIKTM